MTTNRFDSVAEITIQMNMQMRIRWFASCDVPFAFCATEADRTPANFTTTEVVPHNPT